MATAQQEAKPHWTDHLKALETKAKEVSKELDAEITKELSQKPSIMVETAK